MGADLRVTTQLVEAETGAILWSQKFDRPLAELAHLQEDLVTEVAGRLGVTLQDIEIEKALRKPGDLTAYEAILRSGAALSQGRMDSEAGVAEARKAVALAPDFAVAHSTLAAALAHAYQAGRSLGDPAVAQDAVAHAQRALDLASGNAMVLSQAAVALSIAGHWPDGLVMAERAVELNPNLAHGRYVLAMAYVRANRNDDALAQLDAESVLAPRGRSIFNSVTYRATAHFQAGRLDLAVEALDRALVIDRTSSFAWTTKAYCCEIAGRRADAQEATRRYRALSPDLTPEIYAKRIHGGWTAPEFHEAIIAAFTTAWDATPLESVGP
jgi:tetratricopeptide (TPR) repeat protein